MKKTLLAVLLLAGLSSFSVVKALEPIKIDKAFPSGLIQAANKLSCEKIAKAMENRISIFDNRQNFHVPAYNNLKSRLDTLISKLEARGYDVVDLKTEVATLGDKIDKLSDDYDTFLDKLKDIKSYADDCASYKKADVQTKLTEARALLKIVRNDGADIRNYFKTVIRPDIVQIRKQKLSN